MIAVGGAVVVRRHRERLTYMHIILMIILLLLY